MPGDHALTSLWEGGQEIIGLDPMASKGGRDLVTECVKARVLGNQKEATTQLQHCNGRPDFEGDSVAVRFRQRDLPFLAQPGRRQIL
jgi:hypothetical protein